jgi:hypothetical protein
MLTSKCKAWIDQYQQEYKEKMTQVQQVEAEKKESDQSPQSDRSIDFPMIGDVA